MKGEATPTGLILCKGKNTEYFEFQWLLQRKIRVADCLGLLLTHETFQSNLHRLSTWCARNWKEMHKSRSHHATQAKTDPITGKHIVVPLLSLTSGRIYALHKQHVMLGIDLAKLYGVQPKVLVQAVKRNLARFSEDFVFHLTADAFKKCDRKHQVRDLLSR